MTPTPAELAAAMETVRRYEAGAAAQWPITSLDPTDEQSAFELLARWLAENAQDLAMGDEHIRAYLAAALAPAFPEVEVKK